MCLLLELREAFIWVAISEAGNANKLKLELPASEMAVQINASQSGGPHQSQFYHTA